MTKNFVAPPGAPCWLELETSDPAASGAFYGELFGWTMEESRSGFEGFFSFFKDGVPVAGATKVAHDDQPDRWSVFIRADDIAATVRAVERSGGRVRDVPHPAKALGILELVEDCSGAHLGLWKPGHPGIGMIAEPGVVDWFELRTPDRRASVRFYEEVFGWTTRELADLGDIGYTACEDAHAGILDASASMPAGSPARWVVYLGVLDVDATTSKVVEQGGAILSPREDSALGRRASARDATGASFELTQLGPSVS